MEDLKKLFFAHFPRDDFIKTKCEHYYCNVMSIITLKKSPDISTETFKHSHDEYEVMIPLTPIPLLEVDGRLYFGEVGYAYPVNSNEMHGCEFNISDVSHDHITIKKDFFDNLKKKYNAEDIKFDAKFEMTQDLKAFIQIFKEYCTDKENEETKMEVLATIICCRIIELGLLQHGKRERKKEPKYKKMREIITYLNNNFSNSQIEIDKLAQMVGYDNKYFISAFKEETGETPYSYLTKLRISQAKILLEKTKLSMAEISKKCGFDKPNTFSAIFKKATKRTPLKYREEIKSLLK